MKYKAIKKATFLERPNRFIAMVEIEGRVEATHVKNTGRCKEILKKGCTVILQKAPVNRLYFSPAVTDCETDNILITSS